MQNRQLFGFFAGVFAMSTAARADNGPGFGVVIFPERPTTAEMSNRDINRVVCSGGNVEDYKFSGEKGIIVDASGSDAFVKFQIMEIGEVRQYVTARSEFFFKCAGEMYTVFATPRDIPSQTIFLGKPGGGAKENAEIFNPLSDEERAVSITQAILRESSPSNFSRVSLDEPYAQGLVPGADVRRRNHYLIEGSGFSAAEFLVRASRDVVLNEMMFARRAFGRSIYAVTLETPQLKAGEVGRVVIVYRGDSK